MSANSHFINMGNCPSILIGGLAGSVQVEDSSKSYKGDLRPYPSSLEYLDDAFQVLALKLRMAKARHKEALKEAIDDRPWYGVRSSKVTSFHNWNITKRCNFPWWHQFCAWHLPLGNKQSKPCNTRGFLKNFALYKALTIPGRIQVTFFHD